MRFCVIGLIIATGLSLPAPAHADSVDVGVVAAMGRAPEFIAFEKGYFRDVGLDVHLIEIDLSSDSAAANANGSLPIIGGAISVGFFNSIAKGFPVRIMLEAGSTPIGPKLMIRPDLNGDDSLADLKGRTVNLVAPGSSIVYVTGRMLETVGLSLRDVETKYLPFSQVAPAFANKAIDAAVLIQPTVATIEAAGLAVPWIDPDDVIRPTPMFISGTIVNTDWVKRQPDAARRFFYAVMRGVRYYCTAYHGGSNRGEVIAIINKHTAIKDPEFLDRTTWLSRTALGLVPVSSLTGYSGLLSPRTHDHQTIDPGRNGRHVASQGRLLSARAFELLQEARKPAAGERDEAHGHLPAPRLNQAEQGMGFAVSGHQVSAS